MENLQFVPKCGVKYRPGVDHVTFNSWRI